MGPHICTCEYCSIQAFDDKCAYELRALEMLEDVLHNNARFQQNATPEDILRYVLEGGSRP